jgi:hypothetical protein
MAASDYVPGFFKNRLHLAGRPQMGSRPSQRASRRLVTLQNRIQVELMNRPLGLDVGNWKSLELICGRPVHRGFSPNDKADLFAMLAGNPDDVVGVEPFPKGASS